MVWKFCGKAQFPHSFGRITLHLYNFYYNQSKQSLFQNFCKSAIPKQIYSTSLMTGALKNLDNDNGTKNNGNYLLFYLSENQKIRVTHCKKYRNLT